MSARNQSRSWLRHGLEYGDGLHAQSDHLHHLVQPAGARIAPGVPYAAWAVFFAGVFTLLNIQGVKTSARVNSALAAGMGVVIAIFFVVAARYIFGHPHDSAGFYTHPSTIRAYGIPRRCWRDLDCRAHLHRFDGISTLSEEAENPRRNILLATVMTCLVIGILSAVEVYVAQLIWPASQPFPDVDTAFVHVAGRAWGPMFGIIGFTLLVANFGSGMGAQIAPPACFTVWGEATRCRNLFSEWSTPSIECRGTTFCLSE